MPTPAAPVKDDEPTPDDLSIDRLSEYHNVFDQLDKDRKAIARGEKATPTIDTPDATPARLDKIAAEARPKAAVAVPAEPIAVPDADMPAGLSDKGKSDWKTFKEKQKAETDRLTADLKARNDEITQLKAHTPSLEMERLKKERDELSEQVRLLNVVEHPKFKAYFNDKAAAILKSAKAVVGEENAAKIEKLLTAPDSDARSEAIDAIMDTLGPSRATRLANAVTKWSDMEDERASEIGKARDNYALLQEQQRTQQDQARQTYAKTFDDALAKARDPQNGLAPFQNREDDSAWNEGVTKRTELAKAIYTAKLPPEDLARACLWAASGPALAESAAAVLEENGKLKAELASIKGATPSPGGGQARPSEAPKKYEGPDGALNAILDGARAAGLPER